MKHSANFTATLTILCLFAGFAFCDKASAQAMGNPGFKALPRPVNYAMPLAPKDGARAVIVYGKDAPWTKAAAEVVQKAIQDWCGTKLDLADDRTVTSEKTWLLTDDYRKTPLIVLGNAQDNRVMHAMGTRMLLRSNRTWPGGDRFVIRSMFEPFVANVNYLLLEASNQAGMDGAVAKLADLLKTFGDKAKDTATIPPRVRVLGGVKDKYENAGQGWRPPAEWARMTDASISELIRAFKGAPSLAGTPAWNDGITSTLYNDMVGATGPGIYNKDPAAYRALAAMCLLGCRAQNGRTHGNFDHYGALGSFVGIRAVFQSGVLDEEQLREFESCIVLSTALPLDYVYNNFGGEVDMPGGNRHWSACLVTTVNTAEYILTHCRMDEFTRKEIERRYAAVKLSIDRVSKICRDFDDSDMAGEDTLMHVSAILHDGRMEYVRSGKLRKSTDFYMLNTDNMPGFWGLHGNYVGLAGFSSGPGGIMFPNFGGGLLEYAAFYYDDPQLRWQAANWAEAKGSRGGGYLPMFTDTVSLMTKPVVGETYDGVRALLYDKRVFDILQKYEEISKLEGEPMRRPHESFEKSLDRLAFRDDFDSNAAFMLLTGCSNPRAVKAMQNNMIARYTDLSQVWLYTNVNDNSGWARNVVSISNGKKYLPRTGCSLDAMMNLGEVSAISSREPGVAGADWTRTIVHWRGHYFVVIDRMEAMADDEFAYVCRWRCPQLATLRDGAWTAIAPNGSKMTIQNTEPIFQTSEFWETDGAARPYVLQQYKGAKLAKGQAQTFQNLLFVSGSSRPDQFEVRHVNPRAMLVQGQTKAGNHLALVGVNGQIPLEGFETDAAIYDVTGNALHLAEVTTLKAKVGSDMREVFHSETPVNLLVNCDTGKGQVEVRGDAPVQAKAGDTSGEYKPGRTDVAFAQAGALPRCAGLVEALWARSKPVGGATEESTGQADVFAAMKAETPLARPLKLLTNADITSTPAPSYQKRTGKMWRSTDNLEIILTVPESADIGCVRLVGVNLPPPPVVGRGPTGAEWLGTPGPYYQPKDMAFSLVLSDDGFKNDVRKVDSPRVVSEYTCYPPADHSTMQRFPTWRIEIGQKARQIKLLPRATTKERPRLDLHDIEIYAAQRVDELSAKAFAADINGDGSNEFIVGTSEKQVAAYDAQGKQLWCKDYPGDILRMAVTDLEEDGKAETIAYLMTETLHRVNGDGSERPGGDVLQGEKELNNGCFGVAGASAMIAWAPVGADKKEVLLLNEYPLRVLADGSVKGVGRIDQPRGCGRLVNLYPGEPEVLVTVGGRGVSLWSARLDKEGNYTHLGSKPQVPGPDGGAGGWAQQVNVPGFKGFLAAYQGGVNYYPIAAFEPKSKESGWQYSSGGVPAVAAMAQDINGDGVPEVFMARLDGFVNVLKLADGSELGLLNTGQPILGLAMLKGKDSKPCIAVGTKFGVRLFSGDLKPIGSHKLSTPAAGFAGPGGKDKDRVYVIDAAGNVTVLTIK